MFEEDVTYRILVVEDSILNQHIIHGILADQYVLAQALTAKDALDMVSTFRPHLILLDIILPDADGFQILASLKSREETQNIPVIVITGLGTDEYEERGFMLGAVDYIKKPFKNEIVRARVNTQMHIIKQMKTIERLSMIDSLTSVSNRRAFDKRIQYEWSRAMREKSALSMMMLDIDNFKAYNDTYGHPQGDLMLQCIAETLKAQLKRSTDQIFRYGGEEFCVLLPSTDLAGAIHIAEQMRGSVERTEVYCICSKAVTCTTVSIGIASTLPQTTDQMFCFIERADSMLYKAKHHGRNQVQFE